MSQTSQCQNCKNRFTIEPEDFEFYGKIKVPPPTWCPECRLKRRMIFRNEMSLYKRKCDFTGEDIFSGYSPDKLAKVYKQSIWFSDQWDPLDYGREYDFSRPFFEQFNELYRAVPMPDRSTLRCIDSDYCNNASDLKNCYLLFNSELSENSAYGNGITSSKEIFDSYFVKWSEQIYEGFVVGHSYNVFFSSSIWESHDIYFSQYLSGCSNCFGCINLTNKHYYIFNEPYTKEDYSDKLRELWTGSYQNLGQLKERAAQWHAKFPVKFMRGHHNVNVSGNYITNSRNVHHSFWVDEFEDCKFCYWMGLRPTRDCYDFNWGGAAEMVYEAVAVGYKTSELRFVYECWPDLFDAHYCIFCSSGSSHLFGCVGLRNKQYCILNKQYSKEEYEKLVPQVIRHMNEMPHVDTRGRVFKYGEFFPPELSPFTYNETIIHEYFPITKEEALGQRYQWRDTEARTYSITVKDFPDSIHDVPDSILKEVIGCEHNGKCNEQCTTAFRVILSELGFLRKHGLPLPHLCPNCRHYQRVKQKNPPKLWHRKCACTGLKSNNGAYANQAPHFHGISSCPNEFETSYAPNRLETVYCEQCYQNEVV